MNGEFMGYCRFCGQAKMIKGCDMTQQQADEEATLECECVEARANAKIEEKKRYAKNAAVSMFKKDGDTVTEIIITCLDALARRRIKKLTLNYDDGIKAVITGNEDTIAIEHIETTREKSES